ncbi:MAG: hypothetical protein NTV34_18665 [Proteobacteria bacterium]|nr:hypothetical protein [Pseudomonadota bacterium]
MAAIPVIVFLEVAAQQPLPHAAAIKAACHGARVVFSTSLEQANQVLTSTAKGEVIAVVSNSPDVSFFRTARGSHPNAKNILVTAQTIHSYAEELAQEDAVLLDNIIAQLSDTWTVDELRITLQKILKRDLFGIEKYLLHDTPVFCWNVTSSRDREPCNAEVQKWVETYGLSRNIGRLAFGITEELLMNAIYDAPVAGGRAHYENIERTVHRDLKADEYSDLRYGCDGNIFAISIQDPFGAFHRDKWWHYARKILKRDDADSLIDTKKGGAGLGIFKMLYSSHGVICNIEVGKMTEVIVLIDLTQPVRDFSVMPRSIHYFSI